MSESVDWVASKLESDAGDAKVLSRTPENLLTVGISGEYSFTLGVLGVIGVIQLSDVEALFTGSNKPQMVVNIPSKTLWSGAAIDFLHAVPAAFGTFGDIERAFHTKAAQNFRNRDMAFFINAMEQHKDVYAVSYVYDTVFRADRWHNKPSVTVAVIDAYNMSAEDVRNARSRFGKFDVIVKKSNYGSITTAAVSAADSMGARALKFRELMRFLAQ